MNYTKTCKDFGWTGIDCCSSCHEEPEYELDIVQVDGELALLCCKLRRFFYPDGDGFKNSRLSPEEKLLRAIFGDEYHGDPEEDD